MCRKNVTKKGSVLYLSKLVTSLQNLFQQRFVPSQIHEQRRESDKCEKHAPMRLTFITIISGAGMWTRVCGKLAMCANMFVCPDNQSVGTVESCVCLCVGIIG